MESDSGTHDLTTEANASSSNQLAVVAHSAKVSAWLAKPGQLPQAVLIKGELCLPVRDADALSSGLSDLHERLRGDGVHIQATHWIADHVARAWCSEASLSPWQLSWEWLSNRFGFGDVSPWDDTAALENQVLPWLLAADDGVQREQLQRARDREHADESSRLSSERAMLERENEHLRAQNAALQQVDAERLASFLPALYPRVFTIIGPADLSLLCGRIEPISLPSPYPEPVEETLRVLQKRFRALQPSLQKQIVDFVTSLPQSQRLQARPEMRELIEELKGE